MNECKEHWDKLRHAITVRGMGDFGAQTGKELMGVVEKEMAGEEHTAETFDPLWAASNMIFSLAMKRMGLALLMPDEKTGKPPCPLCLTGPYADNWINGAADEAKKHLDELNSKEKKHGEA